MISPKATIVVTTRNRQAEIYRAIESALRQVPPVEVIVVDDGSTDGTAEMVRKAYPQVRLVRFEDSRGYIVRRNQAAALASAPIIFSVDDDAEFSTPRVVQQTLSEFTHPRIAAVAIPLADGTGNMLRKPAVGGEDISVTATFIGTAHALKREVFQQLGGYREAYFHQGEEPDYCLRLLNAGLVVRCGSSSPINHYESPKRDRWRMDVYGRRNNVLMAWYNTPGRYLLPHLLATSFNGVRHGLRQRQLLRMLWGLALGYLAILQPACPRRPVTPAAFRLWRTLVRRETLPLRELDFTGLPEPARR